MRVAALGLGARSVALLGLVLATSSFALASRMDELVIALGGDNEAARAEARQLLPRESVEVVPKLLPLVAGDDEGVWRAAFNVLSDLIGEVGVPGREAERRVVTDHLMTLLAPEQSVKVRMRVLRLLPALVPDGYPLTPIADLLADAPLRERARAALVELGTADAAAALRAELPRADAAFQITLLDGLSQMRDADSVDACLKLLDSPDARVRIAALRSVAWTGNPSLIAAARAQFLAADDALKADARDVLVRLLYATETQGGNWQALVETYLGLIAEDDQRLKEAALAGLGRIGDGTCVAPILAAIKSADNPTRAIGIDALRMMQGVDVARALVEVYPTLGQDLRVPLLPALGNKKNKLVVPVLTDMVHMPEPEARVAAFEALAATELPEVLGTLYNAATIAPADVHAVAKAGVLRVADALRRDGKAQEAGRAYIYALDLATDKEAARVALAGLAACPVPEALPHIQKAVEKNDLKSEAVPALIAVAGTVAAAGRKEQALQVYRRISLMGGSSETVRLVAERMRDLGANVDVSAALGIITNWWVVGPFELGPENAAWNQALIGEPNVDLNARYMAGKRRLDWRQVTGQDEHGLVDLLEVFGPTQQAIAYAYAEFFVPQEREAVLRIGVDDSERVWVNGEMVFEHFVARGLVVDQDQVPVKLKAGRNVILMKTWQNTLGWEFCVRITTPAGQPVSFMQRSAK